MRVIADTNVFLAVILEEPERADIVRLTSGSILMAPEVLPFELGNALSALLKRRKLDVQRLCAAWKAASAIPVELRPVDVLSSLDLAGRFSIYAYDAYFLECAMRHAVPLLTLDKNMKKVARQLGISLLE